jgi:hypothetical protein
MKTFLGFDVIVWIQVLTAVIVMLSIANWIIGYHVFKMLSALNKRQGIRVEAEFQPQFSNFFEGWQRVNEFNGHILMETWTIILILMLICFMAGCNALIVLMV